MLLLTTLPTVQISVFCILFPIGEKKKGGGGREMDPFRASFQLQPCMLTFRKYQN